MGSRSSPRIGILPPACRRHFPLETLAKDLKFIETFRPEMCGIGPFIPHRNTPFREEKPGTLELTLFLLSVIRLI